MTIELRVIMFIPYNDILLLNLTFNKTPVV